MTKVRRWTFHGRSCPWPVRYKTDLGSNTRHRMETFTAHQNKSCCAPSSADGESMQSSGIDSSSSSGKSSKDFASTSISGADASTLVEASALPSDIFATTFAESGAIVDTLDA